MPLQEDCRSTKRFAQELRRTCDLAALLADKRFAQIAGEERLYKASFRKVAEGSDTGIVNIYFQLSVQLIASRGLPLVRLSAISTSAAIVWIFSSLA
jgi:hypothetical protein